MINHPSIDSLLNKVENKYALVSLVAKRARKIIEAEPAELGENAVKPVTKAVRELHEGKYTYTSLQ